EEIGVSALSGFEVDAFGRPGDGASVLVKIGGENFGRAAGSGNDVDDGVRVEKIGIAVGGVEGDLRTVGRPDGILVGESGIEEFFDGFVGDGEDVNVGGAAVGERRIFCGGEGDARGVGRPAEILDGEVV